MPRFALRQVNLLGGGGQQIIGLPTVMCEEPPLPVGTPFWTDREYVYGPGYVDEFILQIDQDGKAETPRRHEGERARRVGRRGGGGEGFCVRGLHDFNQT